MNSQAFWNDFMRRPEAKAAYQAERQLQEKKSWWLEERRLLEERGAQRKLVADALEEAPADLKKMIAPMFHIRMVEQFLWMVLDECKKTNMPFIDKLRSDGTMAQLRKLRGSFQEGGEDRMKDLESQWLNICHGVATEEEEKQEKKPTTCDIHTLKQVLEFGQECKREGNNKFRDGLYEEALLIYTQGDDVMKKWKVGEHLKNENKWLKEFHLACLKNKAQAALKLELFQTALDAAEAALSIDAEDHKAWYRKVQALKSLGRFAEAEESLDRLAEVGQWHPDRRSILRDCEAERKRIKAAIARHKQGTKDMLGKAFEAGIFSVNRQLEDDEEAARHQHAVVAEDETHKLPKAPLRQLDRNIQLTEALAAELMDQLAAAYGQAWFQERVQKCARDSGFERLVFLRRLKGVAFEVQKLVLERWGFEGSEHGVREMTAAIRDLAGKDGKGMSEVLKEKQDRCLELLYGGKERGMAALLAAQ